MSVEETNEKRFGGKGKMMVVADSRFTESIFPTAFDTAAMDSYTEQQESYQSIFDDKSKYEALMHALAGVIYQEMRQQVR